MKPEVILHSFGYLTHAAGVTIGVSIAGIVFGFVIGALVCVARVSPRPWLRRLGGAYISVFRGVPLLVQLLFIYYFLAEYGLDVPAIVAAVGALALSSAAYQAEILRGALNAVPRGQGEAATALGFSGLDIWRRILLPQALRISTPPLINEFGLGGRDRRIDAREHEHRLRDLSAARGLCRRSPVLSGDQPLPGGHGRDRGAAPGRSGGAMSLALIWHYAPSLLSGFAVTVLCWAIGGALGLVLGFAITLLRRLQIAPLNWLIRAFIELFRGTPFLVQLFLLYAGGPSIGLRLSATAAGILGLALYSSAYFAEIFRAGFAAVPTGQIEAAVSVGMAPFDTMTRVMLPGALIAAVPAIVNMLIILSKETVVLSIITVPELMYQVQTMAAETFTAFGAIFAMAVFYWLLVEAVSRAGARIETRVTAYLAHEGAP
jgi:polar amino acid transport system permease protein